MTPRLRVWFALTLLIPWGAVTAAPPVPPVISIIIDDLGPDLAAGRRAAQLPGAVACAVLPRATHSRDIAELAHAQGKDVMLHLPMEAAEPRPLDPGGLTLDMTRAEFTQTVETDLDAIPYVAGVNNHMGSLITRHPGHMAWLMDILLRRGNLFFIDSRTTAATVAEQAAREAGVPRRRRDVFLDNELSAGAIATQFTRLIQLARRQGSALAIGHPHPETLAFLERTLPRLQEYGLRLVPVSQLVRDEGAASTPP